MGSLRFSEFGDSPAMLLSPHQHSFNPVASYHPSLQQYHSVKPATPVEPSQKLQFRPPVMPAQLESTPPSAGSKRKRDSVDDETTAAPNVEQLPMDASPLVHDALSNSADCSTSIFTCCSEFGSGDLGGAVNGALEASINLTTNDATLTRQKFRRRETADTLSLMTINNSIVPANPNPKVQEQAIDQFTHLLGISWARIGSSESFLQPAVRGWEKYIENHYPLTGVTILAASKALDGAFLTLAHDYENMVLRRFMLFKEDLTEGRLIASDWGTCLARLQRPEGIEFEYDEALKAQRTPELTPTSDNGETDKVPDGMEDLTALPPMPMDEGVHDAMICD